MKISLYTAMRTCIENDYRFVFRNKWQKPKGDCVEFIPGWWFNLLSQNNGGMVSGAQDV